MVSRLEFEKKMGMSYKKKTLQELKEKESSALKFDSIDEFKKMAKIDYKERAQRRVESLGKEFLGKESEDFISDQKDKLITSCITLFGLNGIINNQDGGNVTTIHNANKNIYANDSDRYNRSDYTNTKNSNGQKFEGNSKNSVGSLYTKSQMSKDGTVIDAYTKKTKLAKETSPDHIESLSQYHKDGGFMQSTTQKSDFATDIDNLALTDRSINQSMRDFDKNEWIKKESTEKDGRSNEERFDIDKSEISNQIKSGKKTAKNHQPSNFEKTKYYTKKTSVEAVKSGLTLGLRQACGVLIKEVASALYDEIRIMFRENVDIFDFENLKKHFENIKERILSKQDMFKKSFEVFKEGALGGILSTIITTLINLFMTTYKKIVILLREGVLLSIKIIKEFYNNGINKVTLSNVINMVVSGGILALGIAFKDEIAAALISVAPINNFLAEGIVLLGTGVLSFVSLYCINKLDFFNKKDHEKFEYINQNIIKDFNDSYEKTLDIVNINKLILE